MKLTSILKEISTEAEEKELTTAMGNSFNALGAEFEKNKEEIQQDVKNADVAVNESITALSVIGMLLAAPTIIEMLAKGFNLLIKTFKKFFARKGAQSEEEQVQVAKKIIDFTHKWHKQYIKGLKWILKISGLFEKAGIKGDSNQTKAAEMIYYILIAGLAAYSGINAISAFKQALAGSASHISLAALETAMTSVKASEVITFLSSLGIKVAK